MQWRGFISGTLVGGLTVGSVYFLSDVARSFDQGVTVTYMADEMKTLRHESNVLREMAEPFWLGITGTEASNRLSNLGLFDFAKGSDGLAAGPIYLKLANGQVVEIQAHCARTHLSGRASEGVNTNAD